MEPETAESFPFIVKQPFTDLNFVCLHFADGFPRLADTTQDKNTLQKWRKNVSVSIEKTEKPQHIFQSCRKGNRHRNNRGKRYDDVTAVSAPVCRFVGGSARVQTNTPIAHEKSPVRRMCADVRQTLPQAILHGRYASR